MLFKSFAQQLAKVDEAEGIVVFYASAFGNEDSDGDIIEPGAYADTIRQRGPEGSDRVKMLWQHDWWEPIGRPLKLEEDSVGLKVTGKVSPTQRGKDALALYIDGVITEHSVGIDVLERSEDDRRRITKVRLYDVSPVTWGANPLTPTIDVKSLGEGADRTLLRYAENMKRLLAEGIDERNYEGLVLASSLLVKALAPEKEPALTESDLLDGLLEEMALVVPGPLSEGEMLDQFLTHLSAA